MNVRIFLLLTILVLVALPAAAVQFDHDEHLGYLDDPDCATCHVDGAFSIVPEKTVCVECHDQAFADDVTFPALKSHGPLWAFNHRLEARVGDANCESCHAQDFCLECHKAGFADEMGTIENNMVNIHRAEFQVTHPIAARTDQQLCASCHENKFCVECHDQFGDDVAILSHRKGWTDLNTVANDPASEIHMNIPLTECDQCHSGGTVFPNSIAWSSAHAREARRSLATCQACHPEGDICLKCHSAVSGMKVNPHPKDWNDMYETLDKASGGRSCRKCHY